MLGSLTLRGAKSFAFTDRAAFNVATSLKSSRDGRTSVLHTLDVSENTEITMEGLSLLGSSFPELHTLICGNCGRFEREPQALETMFPASSFARMGDLRASICRSECSSFAPNSFINGVLSIFKASVKHLVLRGYAHLSNPLRFSAEAFPHLTHLELRRLPVSVESLVQLNTPRLRTLVVTTGPSPQKGTENKVDLDEVVAGLKNEVVQARKYTFQHSQEIRCRIRELEPVTMVPSYLTCVIENCSPESQVTQRGTAARLQRLSRVCLERIAQAAVIDDSEIDKLLRS